MPPLATTHCGYYLGRWNGCWWTCRLHAFACLTHITFTSATGLHTHILFFSVVVDASSNQCGLSCGREPGGGRPSPMMSVECTRSTRHHPTWAAGGARLGVPLPADIQSIPTRHHLARLHGLPALPATAHLCLPGTPRLPRMPACNGVAWRGTRPHLPPHTPPHLPTLCLGVGFLFWFWFF